MNDRCQKSGFTLMELMVVIGCTMLILGPTFTVLRSGANSAQKGMSRLDATLTARRILQQVRDDLKMACIDTSKGNPVAGQNLEIPFYLRDLVRKKITPEATEFHFLSFPIHKPLIDLIPDYGKASGFSDQKAFREVPEITYALSTNEGLKKLTRTERFKNSKTTHVLSDQINNFIIKSRIQENSVDFTWQGGSFEVTLQIFSEKPKGDPPQPVKILDLFDVVYPEFLNAYCLQHFRRFNWHSKIQGPDENPLWVQEGFENP